MEPKYYAFRKWLDTPSSLSHNMTLGGGFKYFLFLHLPGEMIHFDLRIFFKGVGSTQPPTSDDWCLGIEFVVLMPGFWRWKTPEKPGGTSISTSHRQVCTQHGIRPALEPLIAGEVEKPKTSET